LGSPWTRIPPTSLDDYDDDDVEDEESDDEETKAERRESNAVYSFHPRHPLFRTTRSAFARRSRPPTSLDHRSTLGHLARNGARPGRRRHRHGQKLVLVLVLVLYKPWTFEDLEQQRME
jgi:hypothetical protein